MSHPLHHSISSAKKHGGVPEDYLPIHNWFDYTKAFHPDFRHRALRHHSLGIQECMNEFGDYIVLQTGKKVPVKLIAEQHVKEDCGFIPKAWDYVQGMKKDLWMRKVGVKLDVNLEGKFTEEKSVEL